MGEKQRPGAGWRAVFLRALARGGSVVAAARTAGVHKSAAYALRARDVDFGARWTVALERARGRLGGGEARLSAGETVRSSRHGRPCVIRAGAGAGRWSVGKERAFLDALGASANVKAAAAAAGVSATAVYRRRALWPGFAERWDAALEQGYARIEMLLVRAAADTLDGSVAAGAGAGPETPAMTIDQALGLLRLHRAAVTGVGRRAGSGRRGAAEVPIERVREEVLRRVRAMGGGVV